MSVGQNSSIGASVSAFEQYGSGVLFDSGATIAVNYQHSFSERLGLKTELVYGDYKNVKFHATATGFTNDNNSGTIPPPDIFPDPTQGAGTSSSYEVSKDFLMMRSSLVVQLFDTDWINGEFLLGPGLYKSDGKVNGIVHSELFFYKNISDTIALGLPVAYSYIIGYPGSLSSIGLSMRYYL